MARRAALPAAHAARRGQRRGARFWQVCRGAATAGVGVRAQTRGDVLGKCGRAPAGAADLGVVRGVVQLRRAALRPGQLRQAQARQVREAAVRKHAPRAQHHHAVARRQELALVRDEQPRAAGHDAGRAEALVEQHARDARVHRRQRVVQQRDVGPGVRRARERQPRLLPARQVQAALAQLAAVAGGQRRQVVLQCARGHDAGVPPRVPGRAEHDVVADGARHDPGHLRAVGHAPADPGRARRRGAAARRAPHRQQLAQQRRQQRALARAHLAADAHELPRRHRQPHAGQRGAVGAPAPAVQAAAGPYAQVPARAALQLAAAVQGPGPQAPRAAVLRRAAAVRREGDMP